MIDMPFIILYDYIRTYVLTICSMIWLYTRVGDDVMSNSLMHIKTIAVIDSYQIDHRSYHRSKMIGNFCQMIGKSINDPAF